MKLGIKGSIGEKQFEDRMSKKPDVWEIHLNEQDVFGEGLQLLEERICQGKENGITVYMHHPLSYKGATNDMFGRGPEAEQYYETSLQNLAKLCVKYDIQCVVHPLYSRSVVTEYTEEVRDRLIKGIKKFNELSGNKFLWENASRGVYSFKNPKIMEDIIIPLNLNSCFDISHAFISYQGDNDKLIATMKEMLPYTK